MDLVQQFNTFAQAHHLLPPAGRVLVAMSGGVDSVVLASMLRQRKQPFGIAHCNFRLRNAESDADEAFVCDLAKKWGVPIFVQHFDTKKYAAENGLSIQMAARELRYRWFEVIREAHDFECIATGHNLNDSVETALLHFTRGTGLTGLGGIPVHNGHVVRPLLFATRAAILNYAEKNNIIWREDSSNTEEYYTRNAIRHRVLPELEHLNPAFLDNAAETLRRLRAADANLQFLLRDLLGETDGRGVFYLKKNRFELLPALGDALFDLLQPFGFTGDQVRQMADCWNQTGTEWLTPSGYRILVDRDALLLTNRDTHAGAVTVHADDLLVRTPDGGRLILMHAELGTPFSDNPDSVLLDADVIQFPLHLRRWQPGDIFQPHGMGGRHQKIQDFFTNQKLSRLEKEQVWILEDSNQTILWVVGMRIDDRVKVGTKTCKLLKLSWIKH
ncbi:MAG: tRNA lysidine(34) synthetase TilS [Lewinellaceae bacterium]|nr:tRNA lysidine(34) synthetase TilS [Lewinellaceae bacterium]